MKNKIKASLTRGRPHRGGAAGCSSPGADSRATGPRCPWRTSPRASQPRRPSRPIDGFDSMFDNRSIDRIPPREKKEEAAAKIQRVRDGTGRDGTGRDGTGTATGTGRGSAAVVGGLSLVDRCAPLRHSGWGGKHARWR